MSDQPRRLNDIAADLGEARKEASLLRAERDGMEKALKDALRVRDTITYDQLLTRRDRLPMLIAVAERTVDELEIESMKVEERILRAEQRQAEEANRAALEALSDAEDIRRKAQARVTQAGARLWHLQMRERSLSQRIGEKGRKMAS